MKPDLLPTIVVSRGFARVLAFVLATAAIPSAGAAERAPAAGAADLDRDYAAIALGFEPNVGQADERAKFVARGAGYGIFLTGTGAALALSRPAGVAETAPAASLRLEAVGAREPGRLVALEPLPGTSNYLRGADPSKWLRNVPTFARVRAVGVYDGVDMDFHGNGRELEYDFVVAPGADASRIAVKFEGARSIELAENGELVIEVEGGQVRQLPPVAYQGGGASKRGIEAGYSLGPDGTIHFEIGDYDRARPLVIDPIIQYGTYLGGRNLGTAFDEGLAVATGPDDSTYVGGRTLAVDFPVTAPAPPEEGVGTPFDPNHNGDYDGFVSRISADGSTLIFSTYLGGSDADAVRGLAVNVAGDVYATGDTASSNFPILNPYDSTRNGVDAFLSRLTADGTTLVSSTFYGGSGAEIGRGVVLEPSVMAGLGSESVIVVGETTSADLTLATPFDGVFGGATDGFLAKFAPGAMALDYATYMGGGLVDRAVGVDVDATGNAYVVGETASQDFPTQSAFDATFNGTLGSPADLFVTKVNTNGIGTASLVYSTYLGGTAAETAGDIVVDGTGAAYLTGETQSTNYPRVGAFDGTFGGTSEAVVTKLAPAGNALTYSSFIGGSGADRGYGIDVDASGAAYVGGSTTSTNLAVVNAYDATANGGVDTFVARVATTGASLLNLTYYGGSADDVMTGVALDGAGVLHTTGSTSSSNLPLVNPLDATRNGTDAFVARFSGGGSALDYATYLGGIDDGRNSDDTGYAIAVDASGSAYVAGRTASIDFPVTGSFDVTHNGGYDAFVAKLSPSGGSLMYSTFIGGSGDDYARGVAVDGAGAAYLAGGTSSTDFPTTLGAFDTTSNVGGDLAPDAWAAKLNASGSGLLYSTYLGGSGVEAGYDVAIDGSGNAYVTGSTESTNFPTANAYDATPEGNRDAFLTKLNASGSALVYSTYISTAGDDSAYAVAVDSAGSATIVGRTSSQSFPLVNAGDPVFFGSYEAFAMRFATAGTSLVHSTYLGGTFADEARDVALDAAGSAYVTGMTHSPDFPTTAGAYRTTSNGNPDTFVTKVPAAGGAFVYSTYLCGPDSRCFGYGIAVDGAGAAYIVGEVQTPASFPIVNPFDRTSTAASEGFLVKLNPTGSALQLSSLLGGSGYDAAFDIALDSLGDVYITGETASTDFPVRAAFDSTLAGGLDAFVVKVGMSANFVDTVGLYDPDTAVWFLRNSNDAGPADLQFPYGPAASNWYPIDGDWDGDGVDTAGVYDPAAGAFHLRNSNTPGSADLVFFFGPSGDTWVPIAGDWNNDGIDTIGLYEPDTGVFYLRNSNTTGVANLQFQYGPAGSGWTPVAGDWDGDGQDTIGLYDPATGIWYLRNTNSSGPADIQFQYGPGGLGWRPLVGNYDGNLTDTVGLYDPSTGVFYLKNTNSSGPADLQFQYGPLDANQRPLAGNWAPE